MRIEDGPRARHWYLIGDLDARRDEGKPFLSLITWSNVAPSCSYLIRPVAAMRLRRIISRRPDKVDLAP